MSQTTGNTQAFIEAQQYSNFILENLKDGLLPDQFWRDVTDFSDGDTLNIKTIGSSTIQDVAEDVDITFDAIDTGTVTLSISEYVGDAWYITDKLRQDGSQLERLEAMRAQEATRALQEKHETDFLATCNSAQTVNDSNTINGFAHRIAANSKTVDIDDFIHMKLAFDKANTPTGGRIAIVDPLVEATLNAQAGAVSNVDRNPQFQGVFEDGFVQNHKFVMNLFGWDIWTSNRLPKGLTGDTGLATRDNASGTEDFSSGDSGVANIFMSIMDDNTRPIMHAWRQQPRTEGSREHEKFRDKFSVTARYGFGAQRVDTLGVLVSSDTSF